MTEQEIIKALNGKTEATITLPSGKQLHVYNVRLIPNAFCFYYEGNGEYREAFRDIKAVEV